MWCAEIPLASNAATSASAARRWPAAAAAERTTTELVSVAKGPFVSGRVITPLSP